METVSKRAQWEGIIERWKQSGKNQVDFCKENAINYAAFGYWKKKITPITNLFIPIKVRESKPSEAIFYKIETPLGLTISIPTRADSDDLTIIFKLLGLMK